MKEYPYNTIDKTKAWLVHAFTASGIVAGFAAIVYIAESNFFMAFSMLFLTVIIDGIDGTFARMFDVTKVLPDVSGKTMDYVIDFATYAIIPAYLIYQAHLVPSTLNFLGAAIILLVSTLYYGKEGMVSNDLYFVGFPVMWNLVAFYLYYVTDFSMIVNFILIIFFAILHFVPIKYLYPSRTQKFKKLNVFITTLLIISNFIVLVLIERAIDQPIALFVAKLCSVFSLLYFGVMSVYHTWYDPDTKDI
jgi:phosphatidylcholine synthase